MEKEDGIAIGHLVNALQDSAHNLERAKSEGKKEEFEKAKREILDIQKRIDSLLR